MIDDRRRSTACRSTRDTGCSIAQMPRMGWRSTSSRIGAAWTSGAPVDRHGVDLTLAADKELVPNRIVGAFNLLYTPEVSRSRIDGTWSRESTVGVATALMVQIRPGIFVGAEARYLRSYEGLGLDRFEGHALFFGPTVYAKLSARSWIALAWSAQVAGRSVDETGALDLVNFERHQATLKFGVTF